MKALPESTITYGNHKRIIEMLNLQRQNSFFFKFLISFFYLNLIILGNKATTAYKINITHCIYNRGASISQF